MSLAFSEVGPDSDLPLFLLHPFPLNRHFWDAITDELGNWGALIIAPDLTGFGDSEGVDLDSPTISSYSDDIIELLVSLGFESAIFCGCGSAGSILLDLWRRYPSKVRGLVFCSAITKPDNRETTDFRKQAIQLATEGNILVLANLLCYRLLTPKNRGEDSPIRQQLSDWIMEANPSAIIQAEEAMLSRPDHSDILRTISVPNLWIAGGEDEGPTGHFEVKGTAGEIPRSTFDLVGNAGPLAPFECPLEVAHSIIRYLEKEFRRPEQPSSKDAT